METKQPVWKVIAQLGDANPIDYGGYFIYEDTTGVYPPEAERLEILNEESDTPSWIVHRFTLDQLKQQTVNGKVYLIPFRYDETWPYPAKRYDEWFHSDLDCVASYVGQTVDELRVAFCSNDPKVRAFAYQAIGEYHGFENLDSYPLRFTDRTEVEKRYVERYVERA